jgi:rod shape-determining protein MreD
MPDGFVINILIMATFLNKMPSVYYFILLGFIADLFFSEIVGPYMFCYFLSGLYLNFESLRWIQRAFLEQMILVFILSLIVNLLLLTANELSFDFQRIVINPFVNVALWSILFFTQRGKWLKNI